MDIGERQTVQRAKHPNLGEGRLVYDNGPAFFLADSGEVETYDRAGWAGCGVDGSRAYARRGAERFELDTTDRHKGPSHERIVAVDGRAGWLVKWSDATAKRERFIWNRFEPDDGSPHETMMVQVMWVGEKRHERGHRPRGSAWLTYKTVGNHYFTFRRECDPAPAEKPASQQPAKTRAGRKARDDAQQALYAEAMKAR